MLTAAEARERLGISQRTLFRLVRSGQLEAFKTRPGRNGRYRISEDAIAVYLKRNPVEPEPVKAQS